MHFRKSSWMVGTLLTVLAAGCASQKSNTDRTTAGYSELRRDELAAERREFVRDRRQQLDHLETQISRLEARLAHEARFVDPAEKAEWSQDLFELRQQHRQTRAELERAEEATPEEWAAMRGDLGYAIDSLQAGVNKIGSEIASLFRSDEEETTKAAAAARGDAGVDLCMVQVDDTSATVSQEGDRIVVRMTTPRHEDVAELRERAGRLPRETLKTDSRGLPSGERATGDRSAVSDEHRLPLIDNVQVQTIDNGVRVVFEPAGDRRTALQEELEREVRRIRNRDC